MPWLDILQLRVRPEYCFILLVDEKRKILFVVNKTKGGALEIASRLSNLAASNGMISELCLDFPAPESAFEGKDVCCVVGGDGTILSCAPMIAKYSLSVFGINMGKLGFLATYTDDISDESFLSLCRGEGRVLERAMLEVRCGKTRHLALNDFVLKDSRVGGISNFKIFADKEFIADYVGDGLIFATPTGATAYNLSAGGPIIHPKARAFVMTPICPHTLSNRSLVYDYGALIRIVCTGGESALLADGRNISTIRKGSEIELDMPPVSIKFARLRGHSHFSILRNKLGWAEDPRSHA